MLSVPYITATDLLGAGVDTSDFVVGGTCSEQLYGVCEAMYKPGLEADDLFEVRIATTLGLCSSLCNQHVDARHGSAVSLRRRTRLINASLAAESSLITRRGLCVCVSVRVFR